MGKQTKKLLQGSVSRVLPSPASLLTSYLTLHLSMEAEKTFLPFLGVQYSQDLPASPGSWGLGLC